MVKRIIPALIVSFLVTLFSVAIWRVVAGSFPGPIPVLSWFVGAFIGGIVPPYWRRNRKDY